MGKCGVCGQATDGTYSLCYHHNAKKVSKAAIRYGTHKCHGCSAEITKDKSYCWTCRVRGKAKKINPWW